MGSNCNINFSKTFGNEAAGDGGAAGGSGRPPGSGLGSGNFGLMRQTSVYSLTFDEFQNTIGGVGKDFGSMNIWSAEETQCMATAGAGAGAGAAAPAAVVGSSGQEGGYLQRQGSLTLPRTLSQKTADEVWKEVFNGKDGGTGSNVPQRQQTLGEITLEEFLVRAGVLRDDNQPSPGKPTNTEEVKTEKMGVVIIDGTTVRSFVEDETQFNKSVDNCFAAFDLNGDGTLSRSELRKAFESMRLIESHYGVDVGGPNPAQITALYDSIFEGFDLDHNGTVDLEEFRAEMRKIMLAIADGLGECPIQMALEDGTENLLQNAADLEASKLKDAGKSTQQGG